MWPCIEWGTQAALRDDFCVSRGRPVGFGSLSVAPGETLGCRKVVTWWLIPHPQFPHNHPKVWHFSGWVSLLLSPLIGKPGALLWTGIRPGSVEPRSFNLSHPFWKGEPLSLQRCISNCRWSWSQSMDECNGTLLSNLSFLLQHQTAQRTCPVSDQNYHINQDQTSKSPKNKISSFQTANLVKITCPGPFLP